MSSSSMPGNLMQEHYRQTVYQAKQMATNAANTCASFIPTGALGYGRGSSIRSLPTA